MISYTCSCGKTSLFFDSCAGRAGVCPSCQKAILLEVTPVRLEPKILACPACHQRVHRFSEACLFCHESLKKTHVSVSPLVFWIKRFLWG